MLHRILPNGLEVVLKENHFSKMVAIQCWVKAGSLDEDKDQRGMAHLIEHMLFKGTTKRKVGEISATVEACGGDMNAYTTFDRTVYYLTLSSRHTQTGIELLSDAIFNSTFDPVELAKEKEVVLEEIRRGNDSPSNKVGRKVFECMYAGTEAARPIIGSEESVAGFERQDVMRFYNQWYQPENISLVMVGDFHCADIWPLVLEHFGRPQGRVGPRHPLGERCYPKSLGVTLIKGDYQQPRLEIAFPAPGLEHTDTIDLDLVAFALGAGDASRLNRRLRDREGVVGSVGCSLYAPHFGGIFELSAFAPEETYLKALTGLAREVALIRAGQSITTQELGRARANLRMERCSQEETVVGQARSLGYGLMTSHKTLYDDVYETLVNKTTVQKIQGTLERWLNPEHAVIVGLLPQKSTINEEDVRTAFRQGLEEARRIADEPVAAIAAQQGRDEGEFAPVLFEMAPGIKLVYRQNPSSQMFSLVAASEGGVRGESREEAGLYHALSSLLGTATRSLTYDQLLEKVEGAGAELQGFSGKDSFGVKLHCLADQISDLLPLWIEAFLHPEFAEEQWDAIKRDIMDTLRLEEDSPSSMALRAFQERLYGEHPYRWPAHGLKESVLRFTPEFLKKRFLQLRDDGPWVLGCVGPDDPATMKKLLETSLVSHWKPRQSQPRVFAQAEKALTQKPVVGLVRLAKDKEQTHIVMGFRGLAWGDKDRAALDVLSMILGGSGGRLFLKLRDAESLAYSVSPLSSYGKHPGVFGAYIATANEKVERAQAALMRELSDIQDRAVDAGELERAVNYLIGSHEADLERGEAQAMTLALMELYGIGYNDFLTYPKKVAAVKVEDVQKVACRLMKDQPQVQVMVGPLTA